MSAASEARAEIEEDRLWRSDEIRLLRNQLSGLTEAKSGVFRRSLVVMVYAHLEGFCARALEIYIAKINELGLRVRQVDWGLAAAALAQTFDKLHNKDLKCLVFKNELPNDTKLHRFARDRDFLESIADFEQTQVLVDSDTVVSTGSNLKPVVLRKMLFRLGLDHAKADPWSGKLNQLLGKRNNIAHGATRSPVDAKEYSDYETAAAAIMDAITDLVFETLNSKTYLRVVQSDCDASYS